MHTDFSITKFEFTIDLINISSSTRISLLNHRYRKINWGLYKEKTEIFVSKISKDFHQTKNFSFKSHKTNWTAAVNCTSLFFGANPISVSPTRTNTSPIKHGPYSDHVTLEDLAKDELLRWMENFAMAKNSATISVYDNSVASTTDWERSCNR